MGLAISGDTELPQNLQAFKQNPRFLELSDGAQMQTLVLLSQADQVADALSREGRGRYFSYHPPKPQIERAPKAIVKGFPAPTTVGATRHVLTAYTDAEFDADLNSATDRLFTRDSQCSATGPDVACPVSFLRNAGIGSFGSAADGLESITTQAELNAVFQVSNSRVKVVSQLDFCGSFNVSIIGCARTPGNTMIIERGFSGSGLFVHEFGHNVGLDHREEGCGANIMFPSLASGRVVNQSECNAFGGGGVTLALNVNFEGNGAGQAEVNPIGLSCSNNCALEVPFAANVQIVLTPAAGSIEAGCSGGCSFVMNKSRLRSVRFLKLSTIAGLLRPSNENLFADGFE